MKTPAKILAGVLLFALLVRLPNPPGIPRIGTIEVQPDGWLAVSDWSFYGDLEPDSEFEKLFRRLIPSATATHGRRISVGGYTEGQTEWLARHRWLFQWR